MPSPRPENPVLISARREALVVFCVWLATLSYTVGYCYRYGYGLSESQLTYMFGFPSWIFWGVVVPWFVCFLFSCWFAFGFMQDAPMGDDAADEEAERV